MVLKKQSIDVREHQRMVRIILRKNRVFLPMLLLGIIGNAIADTRAPVTPDNDGLPAWVPLETCNQTSGKSTNGTPCYRQPAPIPFPNVMFKGPLYQPNMEVRTIKSGMNRTWILPASPATTTWGFFDYSSDEAPALEIAPGDSVAIETVVAGGGQVVPGITIDKLSYINGAVNGRGPHTMTGPIKVNGAKAPQFGQRPVDFVAVHINKIRMLSYATNNSGDSAGLFPQYPLLSSGAVDTVSQMIWPNPRPSFIDSYYLDNEKMTAKFNDHITIPLRPFPGVLAVARSKEDIDLPYYDPTNSATSSTSPGWCVSIPGISLNKPKGCDTKQPGPWGGNLDIPVMTVGSTTYLPVFEDGAMIWTGDSHAAQGNGEIDLDALETAYPELNVTIDLVHTRDRPELGEWPIIETKKNWATIGYDLNMNTAMQKLLQETHRFIMAKYGLDDAAATVYLMKHWDCPISEVVDEVNGTYCLLPKTLRAPKSPDVLKQDSAKYWVSYQTHPTDLMTAMKNAAYELINRASGPLGISRGETYTLATFAMDCRIGRPNIAPGFSYSMSEPYSGPYAVSCRFPKSLLDKP